MTIEERWTDANTRAGQFMPSYPPDQEMPTLHEWALMYLIAGIYFALFKGWGPDACGEPGTEPRSTWEQGGTFEQGFRAMWGL